MKIGIDISQLAYQKTGVATYLQNLVENLILQDSGNDYVLFYASLRRPLPDGKLWKTTNGMTRVTVDQFPTKVKSVVVTQLPFPPTLLDLLWNKLHIIPIEWLIGPIDIFISSDWTQPPSKAKKITIIYDMIVYKYPKETAEKIVRVQKKRLKWVKKEVDKILCISNATKKDAMEILKLPENRLEVIYPGI